MNPTHLLTGDRSLPSRGWEFGTGTPTRSERFRSLEDTDSPSSSCSCTVTLESRSSFTRTRPKAGASKAQSPERDPDKSLLQPSAFRDHPTSQPVQFSSPPHPREPLPPPGRSIPPPRPSRAPPPPSRPRHSDAKTLKTGARSARSNCRGSMRAKVGLGGRLRRAWGKGEGGRESARNQGRDRDVPLASTRPSPNSRRTLLSFARPVKEMVDGFVEAH